jgi:hypothetical protein
MDEIDNDLAIAGGGEFKNLYDLLGFQSQNRDTLRIDAILEKVKELEAENHRNPNKTAEVDARGRLLGKARKFFESKMSRQEYDLALKLRPFDKLTGEKFENRTIKKYVTYEDYSKSIDETREIGFTLKEAEWYVYDFYCVKRKFPPPRRIVKSNRWQCPSCFQLNDEHAKFCRCGIPLKIRCQKCQAEASLQDGTCKNCGFPIRDMLNAVPLRDKAKQKLAENQIADAEDFIRQANGYWRECPGLAEVKESLNEQKKQQEKILGRISDLEKQIKAALSRRNIYEAHELFLQLRRIPNVVTSLEAEEKRVRSTLADVQTLLKKLHSLDSVADRMLICEDILAMAADCEEARSAFRQFPPLPPTHFKTAVVPSGIELNWEAPQSRRRLAFLIVRKSGGIPTSHNDGEILAQEHPGTRFVDSEITVGVIYGYAVFTSRDQTVEHQGCRSELVQIVGDVQNVTITPGNKTLTFSWDEQHGCIETRVTRFDAAPASHSSGTPIPVQRASSFIDTKLENGRTYYYRIQSVFLGVDGKPVLSRGRQFPAKPQAPPPPVIDLKAKRLQNENISLTWTPPDRGEVFLFDLPISATLTGKPVEYTTLVDLKRRFGEPITILDQSEGQTEWRCASSGVRHIIPVTFLDGIAVFGRRIRQTNISDITNLQMQMSGTVLYLTWEWPKDLEKVLILYRHDQFPLGINDHDAARRIYTKQEYDRVQGFALKDVYELNHWFSIHALVEHSETSSCSNGVKLRTAKTVIHYDLVIRRRFGFFGQVGAHILLTIASGEPRFPELVVHRHRGCPPLTREFGVPIMTIPETRGTSRTIPFDTAHLGEEMYMKIFLKDAAESRSYHVEGPLQHNLKLELQRRSFSQWIRGVLRFLRVMR